MAKELDADKICITCMAGHVSETVLNTFTEAHPDVKMSYDQWSFLGFVIEEAIKEALGVNDGEAESMPEKVVIQ